MATEGEKLTRNQRWRQFSLRGLLAAVTLAAVAIGGMFSYIREMAAYHERERDRHIFLWRQGCSSGHETPEGTEHREAYFHHRRIAAQYREAAQCLWPKSDQ